MISYSYFCYKSRQFPLNFLLMLTFLFMKIDFYEFNTSVNQGYSYAYVKNLNSTKSLRFRDFEPRSLLRGLTAETEIMAISGFGNSTSLTNRKPRGFQFHADDKDITIDMEFIVPFVRIPIERSMDMTMTMFRNVFNLNIHSLLTTGAVVAVGGILAIIFKILFIPFVDVNTGYWKTARNEVDDNFPYQYYDENSTDYMKSSSFQNSFVGYLTSKLQENNIDVSKCIQKSICEYVQTSNLEVKTGSAGSMQKILDGILSFKSVHNAMKGTAVQEAVQTAMQGLDCASIYGECRWSSSTQIVFKTMAKFMKYLYFT